MEDRLIYIPIVCGIIIVTYMFYAMATCSFSFTKSGNNLNSTMENTCCCCCCCECKEENNE